MKNLYIILIIIFISTISLVAQRQGISVGGNIHIPVGEFADIANIGYGGSATYEHPLGNSVLGVLYTGYSYFDGDFEGFNWSMVPVLGGIKAYLTPQDDWYFGVLIGANFLTLDAPNILSDESSSTTEFQGNANFGYEIRTDANGSVDISAGYVYINELSYIGIRVAYIFKL
jgi:hypothetical protein